MLNVFAFTTMWSEVMRDPGGGDRANAFVCSDHVDAKEVACELAREVGFEPVNGGTLAIALYAETLEMFVVRHALDSGYGKTITYRAIKVR